VALPDTGDYRPEPVDTSGIRLDDEVEQLVELLARNTHEIWARTRLAQGWVYGPRRDDVSKQHPGLIPYEQLTEGEKEYDRRVARGTLTAITAFGYRLSPTAAELRESLPEPAPDEHIRSLKTQLEQRTLDLHELTGIWRGHSEERWAAHADLYSGLATLLLERGSPLLAHDVLSEGLKYWPRSVRLRQLQGLALARCGSHRRANDILRQLYDEGERSSETVGILARSHKDLAHRAKDAAARRDQLQRAYSLYLEGFRGNGDIYPGINAAAMAVSLDEQDSARELASDVRDRSLIELDDRRQRGKDCYYQLATLGEAALILGDRADAQRWYTAAVDAGRGRFGDLASTRRNARLILAALHQDSRWIDEIFGIPRVVVFAGLAADRPREGRRLSQNAERLVSEAIAEQLAKFNASFGFASAASGADVLFLESMTARGGETHVVLPYDKEQFVRDRAGYIAQSEWRTRFSRALDGASEVVVATGQRFASTEALDDYANLLLLGLATLQARDLETEVVPLALTDSARGNDTAPGGTAEQWRALGQRVEVVPLAEPAAVGTDAAVEAPEAGRDAAEEPQADLDTRIMGILFADVLNFTKLTDVEIPLFVTHFLGAIDRLASRPVHTPVARNTWGDGLFFVFPTVRDAGVFALDLCDLVARADWKASGLRGDLNVRVALHAGPLFACVDPITRMPTFTGRHVVRAARLEPVTPPGLVYATRDFAALSAAHQIREFACEPVGRLALAKQAGVLQVYVVSRRSGES
jgi:hypothetical protein